MGLGIWLGLGLGIRLGLGLGRMVESLVVGTWLGILGLIIFMVGLPGVCVSLSDLSQLQRDVSCALLGHGFGQQRLQR
jgi:hypothetical protein